MSVATFIPTLWAARLLRQLERSHVYAQAGVVNRDYEGEIRQKGDTVRINTIGSITIGDYTGADIGAPEELATTPQDLVITEAKFYNFKVDDVDKAQAAGQLMGPAVQEASYGLSDLLDVHVAAHYVNADAGNLVGTGAAAITIASPADAYDHLVELSVKLDEANVPEAGRSVIIPAWFAGMLAKDTRLIDNVPGLVANGLVGMVDRLKVMRSNNVPVVTSTEGTPRPVSKIIALHPLAISVAEQIVNSEAYRPQGLFADAVKGLHVYGSQTVRPEAIAVGTVGV